MNDIDKSFYDLVVKERDLERHRVNALREENHLLKMRVETLQSDLQNVEELLAETNSPTKESKRLISPEGTTT